MDRKKSLQQLEIYVDASFDKRTKLAKLAYVDSTMTVSGVLEVEVKDINQAELMALNYAMTSLSAFDCVFYTDSQYAVEKTADNADVRKIKRSENIADFLTK